MLNLGILKVFLASGKQNNYRKILFKIMSQKFIKIYCRSFKFERDLQNFRNKELILDTRVLKLSNLGEAELYNLMWSLVFCNSVTRQTKDYLKTFLPINYPVTENLHSCFK